MSESEITDDRLREIEERPWVLREDDPPSPRRRPTVSRYVDLAAVKRLIAEACVETEPGRTSWVTSPQAVFEEIRALPTVDVDALREVAEAALAVAACRDITFTPSDDDALSVVRRFDDALARLREQESAPDEADFAENLAEIRRLMIEPLTEQEPAPMGPDHKMAAVVSAIHDERERISREMGIPLDALAMGEQEPAHLSMEGAAGYSGPRKPAPKCVCENGVVTQSLADTSSVMEAGAPCPYCGGA